MLLAVTAFIDGPEAALAAFRAEATKGNHAYESALATLRADFSDVLNDGPIRAAEFLGGDAATRERVRQDVVTVGKFLLGS